MPSLDYRAARALLPLADVLTLLGFVPARRHGAQLRGPCPLHRARAATSRSFAAQQPLHTAVLDLCQRLGRDVPWRPAPGGRKRPTGDHAMPEP